MPHVHPTEARCGEMLQRIGGLVARTEASERAIRESAAARLQDVQRQMDALRPQVLLSAAAADQYQALVIERHRLNTVVTPR